MAKIVYKLLGNDKGVILTRNPETTVEEIILEFKGAPENALAVFEFPKGLEVYRPLVNGECALCFPSDEGEVKVAVTLLNKSARPRRWLCEQIKYTTTPSGDVLVSPNDMNLPDNVTELELEYEEIKNEFKKLSNDFADLKKKIDEMLEGYDLI